MPRCPATKRDGGQCTTIVKPPQVYCYQHNPERAQERKRNASRAGKSNGKEVRDLKRRISDVIDGVLEGTQDRGRAAVAIQGFNALRSVLELERKIRELDDLAARIEALEQPQEGGSRWPA